MLDAIQKVQMAIHVHVHDDGGPRGKKEAASIAIFGKARQARVSSESSKNIIQRAQQTTNLTNT